MRSRTPTTELHKAFLIWASLFQGFPPLENYGGLAQLGERLHGMQEVTGSIPVFSTIGSNESYKHR